MAVEVELRKRGRIIGRPSRRRGLEAGEAGTPRSRSSMKTSITRTGLPAVTSSSNGLGNNQDCRRSCPSTNRPVLAAAGKAESLSREGLSTQPRPQADDRFEADPLEEAERLLRTRASHTDEHWRCPEADTRRLLGNSDRGNKRASNVRLEAATAR